MLLLVLVGTVGSLSSSLTSHFGAASNCLPRVCDALFIEEKVERFNMRAIIFWREIRGGIRGVSPAKVSDNSVRRRETMVRSEYGGRIVYRIGPSSSSGKILIILSYSISGKPRKIQTVQTDVN